jgi:hypothetical protein
MGSPSWRWTQPGDECSLNINGSLIGNPSHNCSAKVLLDSVPQKLEVITIFCCSKPLSYRVICYEVTDNKYTCYHMRRRESIDALADGRRVAGDGPRRNRLRITKAQPYLAAYRHSQSCRPFAKREAAELNVPSALKYLESLQGMALGNQEVALFLFIILAIN